MQNTSEHSRARSGPVIERAAAERGGVMRSREWMRSAPRISLFVCAVLPHARLCVCVYVEYWSEIFYEFSKKLIICLSLSPLVCNHCYETDVTSSDVVPLLAALIHIIHFKLLRISLRRILHIEFDSHYIVMYEWRIWCIHTSDIVFTSKFAFG